MTAGDLDAVCELDRLCTRPSWSRETFLAELGSPVGWYRVAVVDGELAGFLGALVVVDEAHVSTLAVHPERRRRGIGTLLMVEFLREAVGRGCRRITLEVRAGNEPALALYRRLGFRPVGRRPRYYRDNDEDALVMWIEDTSRLALPVPAVLPGDPPSGGGAAER